MPFLTLSHRDLALPATCGLSNEPSKNLRLRLEGGFKLFLDRYCGGCYSVHEESKWSFTLVAPPAFLLDFRFKHPDTLLVWLIEVLVPT